MFLCCDVVFVFWCCDVCLSLGDVLCCDVLYVCSRRHTVRNSFRVVMFFVRQQSFSHRVKQSSGHTDHTVQMGVYLTLTGSIRVVSQAL